MSIVELRQERPKPIQQIKKIELIKIISIIVISNIFTYLLTISLFGPVVNQSTTTKNIPDNYQAVRLNLIHYLDLTKEESIYIDLYNKQKKLILKNIILVRSIKHSRLGEGKTIHESLVYIPKNKIKKLFYLKENETLFAHPHNAQTMKAIKKRSPYEINF